MKIYNINKYHTSPHFHEKYNTIQFIIITYTLIRFRQYYNSLSLKKQDTEKP